MPRRHGDGGGDCSGDVPAKGDASGYGTPEEEAAAKKKRARNDVPVAGAGSGEKGRGVQRTISRMTNYEQIIVVGRGKVVFSYRFCYN